jgi:hypothetical protein
MIQIARYVWAAPCSLFGILLAAPTFLLGASACGVDGVFEVALTYKPGSRDRLAKLLPFSAITFGHIVIGIDVDILARLRAHERVHVRQYEQWGVLFFIAYPLASLIQVARGRRPYWHNYFEVQARERSRGAHNPTT